MNNNIKVKGSVKGKVGIGMHNASKLYATLFLFDVRALPNVNSGRKFQ